MRILIADDNPGTRRVVKDLIESRAGLQVCGEACDGAEAVELAARLAPDLIVLDLTMPRMSGFAAAKAIHAASPEIPLLLFTLYNVDRQIEAQARAVGFLGAISKSSFPLIFDGIESLLQGKPFFSPPPA